MPRCRVSRAIAIAAAAGMLLPGNALEAAQPAGQFSPPAGAAGRALFVPAALPVVADVALTRGQNLEGVVLGDGARGVSGAPVALVQSGRELARTHTDRDGRFAFGAVRGGVYQLVSTQSAGIFRVWAAGTAPPAAKSVAVLIGNNPVVRGQGPLHNLFFSDAFVMSAVIVGAIVVPFAILNSRDVRRPGS